MVGSIGPRCETIRGTHWPKPGRVVVWNSRRGNHLGQRDKPTASTGRTYGCKRSDQTVKNCLWHGGRPHMGPGVRPRACTHVVRRIDSGLGWGIPESGIRVISIVTLRALAEVSTCWRKLTGHWVGSGIVVSIKGGGARRMHGRGQGCLPAAAGEG